MSARFTVATLTVQLDRLMNRAFPTLSVEGELAQLQLPSSGHAYLILKEDNASLQCVVWRTDWKQHDVLPKVGDRVVCHGRMGVYPGQGRYQLYVNRVEPAGKGQLDEIIAKIRERLLADGLLDPRRKRPLPTYPSIIGVVTSPSGAALQDFLKVSRERWPKAKILLSPCLVQGTEAASSMVRALDLLYEDGRAEVIVITRGGGSRIDLMAFDDEQLVRFIAQSPVPVVSAVGHEIDKSLCDEVADVTVPTPTAAAVRVLPDRGPLVQRIDDAQLALVVAISRALVDRRRRLVELSGRLLYPGHSLEAQRHRYNELLARLHRAAVWAVVRRRDRYDALSSRLRALSPSGVLQRGYAIVSRDAARAPGQDPAMVVRDASALSVGDVLRVSVARGTFDVVVSAIRDDPREVVSGARGEE